MKLKLLLITMLISLAPTVRMSAGEGLPLVQIEDTVVYPRSLSRPSSFNFTFATRQNEIIELNVRLELRNERFSNIVLRSQKYYIRAGIKANFSYIIPAYYLTYGANELNLYYKYNGTEHVCHMYVGAYHDDLICLPEYDHPFTPLLATTVHNNKGIWDTHLFDTRAFQSLYTFPHDLHLDLAAFNAYYTPTVPLMYDRVTLTFLNQADLFPCLYQNSNGDPYVDLEMEVVNRTLQFRLANPLYVDDYTHYISPTMRPGFRLTNQLYLPKNKTAHLTVMQNSLYVERYSAVGVDIELLFNLDFKAPYFGKDGVFQIEMNWLC